MRSRACWGCCRRPSWLQVGALDQIIEELGPLFGHTPGRERVSPPMGQVEQIWHRGGADGESAVSEYGPEQQAGAAGMKRVGDQQCGMESAAEHDVGCA